MINCHLSSISHHFRNITSQSQKPPHPSFSSLSLLQGDPSEFRRQTYHAKSLDFTLLLCESRVILTSVASQTTDRQHIMTIAGHCIETATSAKNTTLEVVSRHNHHAA